MAELTKSNVVTTVFGDRRILFFEMDATTSDGHAVTGLKNVDWAGVFDEDGTSNTLQVTKNSNDGTADTLAGAVYVKTSSGTVTVSVIAIGK